MRLWKPILSLFHPVVTTAALLIVALSATAQQERQAQRGRNPNAQRNGADVQVWVGLDLSPVGTADQEAEQEQYARFAGAWTTEAVPGLVLTLQMDGDFSLVTAADPSRRCVAGVERGTWRAANETSELLFHIQTDTNGRCGLSDLGTMMTIGITETGLKLVSEDQAGGTRESALVPLNP